MDIRFNSFVDYGEKDREGSFEENGIYAALVGARLATHQSHQAKK